MLTRQGGRWYSDDKWFLALSGHKGEFNLYNWNTIFVNDSDNDFDLIIELECDGDNVGYIKRKESGLSVVFYPCKDKIEIPLSWLENVINKAKREL